MYILDLQIPLHQQHGFHGQQVTSHQPSVGLPSPFKNSVLFPASRFSAGAGYPFGVVNTQFNASQNVPSMFGAHWNYYANQLPHFSNHVNPHEQITVPINNSLSSLGTSNITVMPNICDLNLSVSAVNDTNSNGKDKCVNAITSESKTVSTPASGTSTKKVLNNDLGDKSKDDITNEIMLKVTTLLSNNTMLNGTMSQIKGSVSDYSSQEMGRCRARRPVHQLIQRRHLVPDLHLISQQVMTIRLIKMMCQTYRH